MADQIQILESVRLVAAEYGIATADLKPCIAFLLDGNLGGVERHAAAFTIAIELRRLDWQQDDVLALLRRWAKKISYHDRGCRSALRSAFAKTSDGRWRYHPPGLVKKEGASYAYVLGPLCDEVGCPANCPPFAGVYRGPHAEGWARFTALDWRAELHRRRHHAAIDVYWALCKREEELQAAPGAVLLTSYRQLAQIAQRDHRTVGRTLGHLRDDGLIDFIPGSGSGPAARDRVPSRIRRLVPIPSPEVPARVY